MNQLNSSPPSKFASLKRPLRGGLVSALVAGGPAFIGYHSHGSALEYLYAPFGILAYYTIGDSLGFYVSLGEMFEARVITAGVVLWFCAGALIAQFAKKTSDAIYIWIGSYVIACLIAFSFISSF